MVPPRASVVGEKKPKEPTTTMTHDELKRAFLQGGEREAGELLNEMMRSAVRAAFWKMMEEEVEGLCGARYHPRENTSFRRAGSEKGRAYLDGGKEEIRRPRVRHERQGEVTLESYRAASSQAGMFKDIVALVGEGLSQRGLERTPQAARISKSTISRMWAEKSREELALVRERPLEGEWLALMIDGVYVGKENCVVIALGINVHGEKKVLDFESGSTESRETVRRLLSRLERRGVGSSGGRGLLVVRDGSEAIKSAVSRLWPSAVQQTCLVHLERNVADRLRRRDRGENQRLFRRLREAEGKAAGEEVFEELQEFVAERNAAAALALQERKEETLALHKLEVPSTLNTTFLSTNPIENVMRNWRQQTGNVKRWNVKGDMLERWAAAGLLWAESGFRKVRGHTDLPKLREALRRPGSAATSAAASPLRSVASAPVAAEPGDAPCKTIIQQITHTC